MSKPTFVLVHGAFHRPVVWDPVVSELDKAGYSAIAPGLPSSDPQRKSSPVTDNSEDVATIRKAVSELVQEHDVVVVMHSLGGLSGSDSLEGLDKQTCTSKGLKGGVIRLIFICAYLVPEGFTYPLNKDTETPHTKFDHEVSRQLLPSFAIWLISGVSRTGLRLCATSQDMRSSKLASCSTRISTTIVRSANWRGTLSHRKSRPSGLLCPPNSRHGAMYVPKTAVTSNLSGLRADC